MGRHLGLIAGFGFIFGCISFLVTGICIVPLFYKLKFISFYEYFEHRFDSRALRQIASGIFVINTISYMAVVMYCPAIALAAVAGTDLWPFILVRLVDSMFFGIC